MLLNFRDLTVASIICFCIFCNGKCKKDPTREWTRNFNIRIFFAEYVRSQGSDFRCNTVQINYCANTMSDLMKCHSCGINGCCINTNLYRKDLQYGTWYGTAEVVDANNGKSLGAINLGEPKGKIDCDFFQSFTGKIPDGNLRIIFIAFEPCFGTASCRGVDYPRTRWSIVINIPEKWDGKSTDWYLNEGTHGKVVTRGACQ